MRKKEKQQHRSQGLLVFHRHIGKREDPGDEVGKNKRTVQENNTGRSDLRHASS